MSDQEEAGDITMTRSTSSRIIGLTGRRGVGKTEVAKALQDSGYVDAHPFEGGKRMCVAYYQYLGADEDVANRMVYGDLKDTPSPHLPGNVSSRYFMERFGKWLGTEMGPEWTIGAELARQKRRGAEKIVVSSVVYEEPVVRDAGATIVKVVRPRHKSPPGDKSDKAVDAIVPDLILTNDGDVDALHRKAQMLA
jgi:hypothetical protein